MSQPPAEPRPNIIWIMADDLSWADIGCYGQEKIQTPNIDRIAREGMRFSQCYSGSTVCAPSRSCLMQGLHQGHARVRNNMIDGYRHSLQPEDITAANILQDAGYATGLFGKWGLAVSNQPGIPNNKGFDSFFGYLNQRKAHNYYPEYLWDNREKFLLPGNRGHNHKEPNEYDKDGRIIVNGAADPANAQYSFDLYAQKAREFIVANKDRPFFLYLAYTPPHGALEVPQHGPYAHSDWPSLNHKIWAAMITRMDTEIGRVLSLLAGLGIDSNTLVFFTTDNGYSAEGYCKAPSLDDFFHHRGPWKGRKGDLHQSGLRVPAMARWPGKIEPNTESDLVWAFWDFLPTAAEVVGTDTPAGIDGISILPTLLGRPDQQKTHDFLYWEFQDEQSARVDEWYMYRPHPGRPVQIYHAIDDPLQENNMAAELPELVKEAERIFQDEHKEILEFPNPGETREAWRRRLQEAGAELPVNVDL